MFVGCLHEINCFLHFPIALKSGELSLQQGKESKSKYVRVPK